MSRAFWNSFVGAIVPPFETKVSLEHRERMLAHLEATAGARARISKKREAEQNAPARDDTRME